MSHEIENMVYVGARPWHGLGVKVDAITIQDALRLAGLDWTVSMESLVLASDTASCNTLDECRGIPARAVNAKALEMALDMATRTVTK